MRDVYSAVTAIALQAMMQDRTAAKSGGVVFATMSADMPEISTGHPTSYRVT